MTPLIPQRLTRGSLPSRCIAGGSIGVDGGMSPAATGIDLI
jgi:hypothetical protein